MNSIACFESLQLYRIIYDSNGIIQSATYTEKRFNLPERDLIGKSNQSLVEGGLISETFSLDRLNQENSLSYFQTTMIGKFFKVFVEIVNRQIVEEALDITEWKESIVHNASLRNELEKYKHQANPSYANNEETIAFSNPSFENILEKIANNNATVLLLGESGTGKSYLAKTIHTKSTRYDKPFISINCTTIPETLFESELFGYAPKAFTGASQYGKEGLVSLADGGTLFLDEIGDMPLFLQSKLLQLIQDKQFLPVGSLRYKKVDIKIITATNKNLKAIVEQKQFREDLYYRLKVFEFNIPPLRQRPNDVEKFIHYYLKKYNQEYNENKTIDSNAMSFLLKYPWPGNIREIQNLIHTLIILSSNQVITLHDLPTELIQKFPISEEVIAFGDFENMLELYEKKIIEQCYALNTSSRKLATSLKISQTKANKLIKKHIGDKNQSIMRKTE